MNETVKFIESLSSLPEGSEAVSECPDAVTAELVAENISAGTFFRFLPLLVELFRNEQVRELVKQILAALKPQS